MTEAAIQKIVCMAVVSDQFRSQLLGADRADVLRSFGLDAKEQEALMSIRAETIEEFAAGVESMNRFRRWIGSGNRNWETVAIPGLIQIDAPPRRE